jgi:DNA-directed RNA polymerase specialized sigma24 family protein
MNIDKQYFEKHWQNDDYLYPILYEIADIISKNYYSSNLDDIKQLAVLRCFRKKHLVNGIKDTAWSYFYCIIHNEFRYHIREELKLKTRQDSFLNKIKNKQDSEDWIRIGGKWWSEEELREMKKEEGTRHKFLKRIRRESNA